VEFHENDIEFHEVSYKISGVRGFKKGRIGWEAGRLESLETRERQSPQIFQLSSFIAFQPSSHIL
jgi:hypothetical protein